MVAKLNYIVLDRKRKEARVYSRKISAIYDHVRFRARQGVWFLELTNAQLRKDRRLSGIKLTYIKD